MWKRGLAVLMLTAAASGLGGCARPLFPEDAARSPYERYLALRGQAAPETVYDAYGREQPALRQRLAPLDRP